MLFASELELWWLWQGRDIIHISTLWWLCITSLEGRIVYTDSAELAPNWGGSLFSRRARELVTFCVRLGLIERYINVIF